ncbi:MAG TPA: hypothetical protein DCQ06_07610, partial [Myxococcales bacterium]|nr:hypothetical protein [Myxococcales bacterium]
MTSTIHSPTPWLLRLVVVMALAISCSESPESSCPSATTCKDAAELEVQSADASSDGAMDSDDTQQADVQLRDGAARSLWSSSLFPANWKPAEGGLTKAALEDYSFAGYHNGETPITAAPGLPTLDVPLSDGDATAAIQQAFDKAKTLGGGIVQLGKGTYRVDGQLRIEASKIIMRGAGSSETFVRFTQHKAMDYQGHLTIGVGLSHDQPIALLK